ncbi:3-deoxy-7-phosphoheptulonate synthase [Polyangium jinanense]|uniref:3-deoxy-7-phosphoheptulonate synthase n=1 Tax=Polyangium jinanense TaxID=2829994 RepID=A0A9X3X944_9BACT|nr:3-deoxy-7-phosphoheptulonate synthase [Polyangium jinanense]MDC3986259.1 3-deoxy-7-phosphoheptulonate synthase [Polyangium jinanense]
MIVTLEPDAPESRAEAVIRLAARYPGVSVQKFVFRGESISITEVHLIGSTRAVPTEPFESLPGVRKVVRVSRKYRLIGRHHPDAETHGFEYNGVHFDEKRVHVFAGLCAVDTREHVGQMMAALEQAGIRTTRMGAYKPRTSPYDFQGLGKACLPWVFELAGKHGIKVIAMEVTDARHIDEINTALAAAGDPTGVMLQIGTRNTQNFELLKQVGQQKRFPVLFKRGMGISLEESLNACEYVASEGNPNIVFCLRGVKTHLGDPHRNLVDFSHVPVVRRQTRLPVCIDPSHAVGRMDNAPDGLPDIFHVVGQGIIAGASMVLIDFHPRPDEALCDGPQALELSALPRFARYVESVRLAYAGIVREFGAATAPPPASSSEPSAA